ncbi:MAG: hypothetical protein L6R42_002516 [Xanthoria sp. 1 TBL-2021]|nr:MAG: hypothetical protein L6R42_002516 [Xanthoria sp. 1 TBL-2021]
MTASASITTSPASPPSLFSLTTLLSLLFSLVILLVSILLSRHLLPRSSPRRHLILHTWHLFDFLIHTIFEGSFLYHSFFSYSTLPATSSSSDYPHPASLLTSTSSTANVFLGQHNRRYGAAHSSSPTALLWQEYARADARWANTDVNLISIELLTVFIAGPLACYICYLLQQCPPHSSHHRASTTSTDNTNTTNPLKNTGGDHAAQPWFLMIVLATGEIYGGFMTFAPEWLSGNTNLSTGDWMYLWLYLVFFNGIWVVMPGWCLWVAWGQVRGTFKDSMERVEAEGKKGR